MKQLFLFTNINDIPRDLNRVKFIAKSVNQNFISYSIEKFGKNLILCLPSSLTKLGFTIKKVYPFDIPVGVVDEINKVNEGLVNDIQFLDFIILLANTIDDVIVSRSILRLLSKTKRELKKYVLVKIDANTHLDDVALFLGLSKIYEFRPVFHVTEEKFLGLIHEAIDIRNKKFCETKWFGFDVFIYYIKDPRINDPLTIMRLNESNVVELLTFRDVYAFLCSFDEKPSFTSIIRYIYESSKPLIQIGDIVISDEFILITETIQRHESIRSTSRNMGVSYTKVRKVINNLKRLEKTLGTQLLEVRRGGVDHGKTVFTPMGNLVINVIKDLYSKLIEWYSKELIEFSKSISNGNKLCSCIFPLLV